MFGQQGEKNYLSRTRGWSQIHYINTVEYLQTRFWTAEGYINKIYTRLCFQ